MSALPPNADIGEGIAECPLLTLSGHYIVLSLRPDCLAFRRVEVTLGNEVFGSGNLSRDDARTTLARSRAPP